MTPPHDRSWPIINPTLVTAVHCPQTASPRICSRASANVHTHLSEAARCRENGARRDGNWFGLTQHGSTTDHLNHPAINHPAVTIPNPPVTIPNPPPPAPSTHPRPPWASLLAAAALRGPRHLQPLGQRLAAARAPGPRRGAQLVIGNVGQLRKLRRSPGTQELLGKLEDGIGMAVVAGWRWDGDGIMGRATWRSYGERWRKMSQEDLHGHCMMNGQLIGDCFVSIR